MDRERIFKVILDSAYKVHTALGPGLFESAYEECLCYELKQSGLSLKRQSPLPLVYREIKLEAGYRVDLMVENKIVVEIKSIESFTEIHMAQILTYLKLSDCKLGLLVNFNVKHLKNGLKRVIF